MRFSLVAVDRRIIYLLVLLALCIPLVKGYSVRPAPLHSADRFYNLIDSIKPGDGRIALVALDYGPNLQAENGSQAEVAIEHILRKGIPAAFMTLYVQGEPYLKSLPEKIIARLRKEDPSRQWVYGTDWVNLGYRPGAMLFMQSLAKSEDIAVLLKKDAQGTPLKELPIFHKVQTLEQISFVAEFTGLVGMVDLYVQFLERNGFRPPLIHGCTSITIPDAFTYLDSGQLSGLLEGIAGAAWYSELLQQAFPARIPDQSRVVNTGLGVAHLVIIVLIVLGNIASLFSRRSQGVRA